MFEKKCSRCDKPATVEMNLQLLCTGHAFDKIVASKGPVEQPKRVK